MSKTYTGKEFKVAFYEAMLEWVKGGEIGDNPQAKWECLYLDPAFYGKTPDDKWYKPAQKLPGFSDNCIYRFKQKPSKARK